MYAFTGQIQAFGFNFAPQYWSLCNGAILQIRSNTALFSLFGTYYGGDGKSTFGLPNLQGASAIGYGQGNGLTDRTIGETGGAIAATIGANNMPTHTHSLTSQLLTNATDLYPGFSPVNSYLGPSLNGANDYASTATPGQYLGNPIVTLANGGSGQSGQVSIQRPYLVMNYCVCLDGVFPSRS